jgi:hypothetical protein
MQNRLPPEFTTPLPVPPRGEMERLYWTELYSMSKLARHYGVGIGTIHKWMHQLDIEPRTNGTPAVTRMHNGEKQRHCKGVTHPEGVWLLESKFRIGKKVHKGRRYMIRAMECMECYEAEGRPLPRVPFTSSYKAWVKSIVNRIGISESYRRLGVSEKAFQHWRGTNPPKTLTRHHARAIVNLMRELRETGEVRHRRSIRSGGAIRGFPEHVPRRNSDYYRPHGDNDTEARRKHRRLTCR